MVGDVVHSSELLIYRARSVRKINKLYVCL